MIRRLPILPTVIVLLAVAVMLRLGFWQLDRRTEKETLLARYAVSQTMSAEVSWDGDQTSGQALLFRRARVTCTRMTAMEPMAGRNVADETGWAQQRLCITAAGAQLTVVIGWARQPDAAKGAVAAAAGGTLTGWVAPGADHAVRLIADPPLVGLQANAAPDPASVPNNHLAYAVQWFLFAGVALVIYALAVRKRLAAGKSPR